MRTQLWCHLQRGGSCHSPRLLSGLESSSATRCSAVPPLPQPSSRDRSGEKHRTGFGGKISFPPSTSLGSSALNHSFSFCFHYASRGTCAHLFEHRALVIPKWVTICSSCRRRVLPGRASSFGSRPQQHQVEETLGSEKASALVLGHVGTYLVYVSVRWPVCGYPPYTGMCRFHTTRLAGRCSPRTCLLMQVQDGRGARRRGPVPCGEHPRTPALPH